MAPRDIAKEVRPLIGLNDRQTQANQNYRQKVYERYREHGASERIASERADKAALKYAGKQHRYRAESIVLTENAFAYNRGAHMGVSQSIADGYMGRCEMVWTTAGTNRVDLISILTPTENPSNSFAPISLKYLFFDDDKNYIFECKK